MALCFGTGAAGSLFTAAATGDWYVTLAKPPWTPPGWLFGPVWAALYLMMAVAAWLVWRRGGAVSIGGLGLFVLQLALNLAWPVLFFGFRLPGVAFGELCLLWAMVLLTLLVFWKVAWRAGLLLVPYLAWTTFAAALNLAIWLMNIQM